MSNIMKGFSETILSEFALCCTSDAKGSMHIHYNACSRKCSIAGATGNLRQHTIGWHVFIAKNPGEIWSYFHRLIISLNLLWQRWTWQTHIARENLTYKLTSISQEVRHSNTYTLAHTHVPYICIASNDTCSYTCAFRFARSNPTHSIVSSQIIYLLIFKKHDINCKQTEKHRHVKCSHSVKHLFSASAWTRGSINPNIYLYLCMSLHFLASCIAFQMIVPTAA